MSGFVNLAKRSHEHIKNKILVNNGREQGFRCHKNQDIIVL